jgi:hypothetical protein
MTNIDPWRADQVIMLKKLWGSHRMTVEEIANGLNRSVNACYIKASRLGLKRPIFNIDESS